MKRKIYKSSALLTIALVLMLSLVGTAGAEDGRVGQTKGASLTAMAFTTMSSLSVDDTLTPDQLAELLVGAGPTAPAISTVTFKGNSSGSGAFSGATGSVGLESGVVLGSGRVVDVVGPNTADAITTDFGLLGDSDLNTLIPGYFTYDATVLEFDFMCPAGTGGEDVISFRYVFTSEEYNEYVNTAFNDVFGFFLNDVNIALLPDGVTPVSINKVNNGHSYGGGLPGTNPSNPGYYINNDLNDGGPFVDIEADGLTVVLGAQANINPGVANHLRLAIADAGDHILDSWVFIEAGSFVCAPLNQPPVADANGPYSVQQGATVTVDGTASYDPDGDVLTYAWDFNNDGVVDSFGATPSYTWANIGVYPVTLQVCDTFDACDTDVANVYVTIMPGLFPPEFTAYVIAGESVTEHKTVNVPPRPPNADVVFAFDLTGSMGGIIGTAKANANEIINQLDSLSGVSIQYGLMSYMDYPDWYDSCGYSAPYGAAECGDYAYQLGLPITNDADSVSTAINALTLGCGGDMPQDYARIFYESYADPNVNWRAGARKILLNFGDDVPHDCNLNEGVAAGVWSTGCDPGRDETAGTSDDLDLQTVLGEMDDNGVTLLEAHTTAYANEHWQYWTGLTGGHVFITGSSTVVEDIVAAITEALEAPMVYGLHLEAESPYESWLESDSMDVDPGDIGVSVDLDVTFTAPPGTEPGEYNFTVYAVDENGVVYGEQQVTIIVLPPSMVTDSGLCTFDRAPEIDGQQFRLIFTPDLQKLPAYKLPASNPGQFFYNVFYAGNGPANLDISIPASFETQGANPVHVYGGRTVVAYDDKICFEPDYENEIFAGTLENLPDELPGGFVYAAIHLDYALKGTTGYMPNSNKDALSAADGVTMLIPNLADQVFSVSGSQSDSQTIQNINEFKKIPGFGGLVMNGSNPAPGETVNIYINNKLLGSAITDEDGWYMFAYKYAGKAATYKVVWSGVPKTGTLKSNKFVEVNFP